MKNREMHFENSTKLGPISVSPEKNQQISQTGSNKRQCRKEFEKSFQNMRSPVVEFDNEEQTNFDSIEVPKLTLYEDLNCEDSTTDEFITELLLNYSEEDVFISELSADSLKETDSIQQDSDGNSKLYQAISKPAKLERKGGSKYGNGHPQRRREKQNKPDPSHMHSTRERSCPEMAVPLPPDLMTQHSLPHYNHNSHPHSSGLHVFPQNQNANISRPLPPSQPPHPCTATEHRVYRDEKFLPSTQQFHKPGPKYINTTKQNNSSSRHDSFQHPKMEQPCNRTHNPYPSHSGTIYQQEMLSCDQPSMHTKYDHQRKPPSTQPPGAYTYPNSDVSWRHPMQEQVGGKNPQKTKSAKRRQEHHSSSAGPSNVHHPFETYISHVPQQQMRYQNEHSYYTSSDLHYQYHDGYQQAFIPSNPPCPHPTSQPPSYPSTMPSSVQEQSRLSVIRDQVGEYVNMLARSRAADIKHIEVMGGNHQDNHCSYSRYSSHSSLPTYEKSASLPVDEEKNEVLGDSGGDAKVDAFIESFSKEDRIRRDQNQSSIKALQATGKCNRLLAERGRGAGQISVGESSSFDVMHATIDRYLIKGSASARRKIEALDAMKLHADILYYFSRADEMLKNAQELWRKLQMSADEQRLETEDFYDQVLLEYLKRKLIAAPLLAMHHGQSLAPQEVVLSDSNEFQHKDFSESKVVESERRKAQCEELSSIDFSAFDHIDTSELISFDLLK